MVNKKYCRFCARQRRRETLKDYASHHKKERAEYFAKREEKRKAMLAECRRYLRDAPVDYDVQGYPCVDETHANWDTFIRDGICVKYLGTVTEYELDMRIYKLKKANGEKSGRNREDNR